MDTREVTHVSRNSDGTIKALGNPGERWSPRSKEAVIRDITGNIHGYHVKRGAEEVEIGVVHTGGRYLRTEPDDPSVMDNLADLPDLFIDDFVVTSEALIVSDPCWAPMSAHKVERATKGLWRATVEITPESRILAAVCEGEKPFEELEQFEVGVDSAQAGIFCESLYPTEEKPTPGFYEACCHATQGESRAGIIMGRGVVASSTDDGAYKAFVGRNKEGFAVAVRIEFDE